MFTNSKSSNFATVGHYRRQNFIQSYTLHIEKTILFYPLNLTQARSDSRCHTHCQINKTQRLPICFIIMTFWLLLLVVCHCFIDYALIILYYCLCHAIAVPVSLYTSCCTSVPQQFGTHGPFTDFFYHLESLVFSLLFEYKLFFSPIQCLSTNGFQPALVFFVLPIFVSWFVYWYLYSFLFSGVLDL